MISEESTFMTTFPSISDQDFGDGCAQLSELYQKWHGLQSSWSKVQLNKDHDVSFLVVERDIALEDKSNHALEPVEDEFYESDDDTLLKIDTASIHVRYTIVRSQTYQVPVLYFDVFDQHSRPIMDVADVYRDLVPETYKSQINGVGVIGGISRTNHPVTDRPSFFVHPCNTADALRAVAPDIPRNILDYFMLWFGIVGNPIRLSIPAELLDTNFSK